MTADRVRFAAIYLTSLAAGLLVLAYLWSAYLITGLRPHGGVPTVHRIALTHARQGAHQ